MNQPTAPQQIQNRGLYFDQGVARPQNKYVCWLDAMGTSSALRRSLPLASNFVMKLHVACLQTLGQLPGDMAELDLFPLNDGLYICANSRDPLLRFLQRTFLSVANEFLDEALEGHQFLVRGAIAYGPVVQGKDMKQGSNILNEKQFDAYTKQVLLGMSVAHAYEAERNAPPFGIFVAESARAFSPEGAQVFPYVFWKWWSMVPGGLPIPQDMSARVAAKLVAYFQWCESRPNILLYPAESIKRHKDLAKEYFLQAEA